MSEGVRKERVELGAVEEAPDNQVRSREDAPGGLRRAGDIEGCKWSLDEAGKRLCSACHPPREGRLTGYGVRLDRDGTGGIRAPSPGDHVLPPRARHGKCLWPGPSRFPWWLFGLSSRVGHSGPVTTSAYLMSPLAKGPLVQGSLGDKLSEQDTKQRQESLSF